MSQTYSVGIIVAMEEEVAYLRGQMKDTTTTQEGTLFEGTLEFYTGTINGVNSIVVRSGIGKVNAAMATTLLIHSYHPRYIINTGSAGGLHTKMAVGDIALSSKVFHHDFDLSPLGFAHGEVPGLPRFFTADPSLLEISKQCLKNRNGSSSFIGHIGTGDFFVTDESYVAATKKRFPEIIAIEMEAAAIAQVCFQSKVPFIVIRAISDVADNASPVSFDTFVKSAGKESALIVIAMLGALADNTPSGATPQTT